MDLRRRQEDRSRQRPQASWTHLARDPLFLLGAGFVLGSAVSLFFHALIGPGLPVVLPFLAAISSLVYVLWRLVWESPTGTRPKLGSEKQLLLAILDAGGAITPVEAALETSLTVDEAEEILTRFADRGHLVVEGRDGTLFYSLPGRRHSPETRTV